MADAKLVRVCKRCSGFDVDELKGMLKAKDYTTGCIGRCLPREPGLKGKVYGFLSGKFTVCANKGEFLGKVAKLIPVPAKKSVPAAKKAAPAKSVKKTPAKKLTPKKASTVRSILTKAKKK